MALLRLVYDHFEEWLSSFFLAVMISALALQVIIRATTGGALAWAEELSRYTFIWAVYIGASVAAKRGAHVCITAQFLLAPVKVRLFFRMLADAVWVGFNIFFVLHGVEMVREALQFPEMSPTLGIVKGYVEIIIPLAFGIMTWRIIELYIKNWGQLDVLVANLQEGQA